MSTKTKFKRFLTTASTMAVVAGGAYEASAENYQPSGATQPVVQTGAVPTNSNIAGTTTPAAANWVNGDTWKYVAGLNTNLQATGPITFGSVNANNVAGTTLDIVSGIARVDAFTNTGDATNRTAVTLSNAAAQTFTFAGATPADSAGLGNFVSNNAGDTFAVIGAAPEFHGTFDNGIITIADTTTGAIFHSQIGNTTPVAEVKALGNGARATFRKNTNITKLNFNNTDAGFTFDSTDGALTLNITNVEAGGDGKGTLTLKAAGNAINFTGNLGADGTALAKVVASDAKAVTINKGTNASQYVNDFNLAHDDASFVFADGVNLSGGVTTATDDKGIVEFKGNNIVTGAVGANAGNAIKTVNIAGDVTFKGGANVSTAADGGIRIAADSHLTHNTDTSKNIAGDTHLLGANSQFTVSGTNNTTVGAVKLDALKGTVNVDMSADDKTATFGQIGDKGQDAQALSKLDVKKGTVKLANNSHIKDITMGDTAVLKLTNDAVNPVEQRLGSVKNGVVEVATTAHDTTVRAHTENGTIVMGTEEAPLKELRFNDAKDLCFANNAHVVTEKLDVSAAGGNIKFLKGSDNKFHANTQNGDLGIVETKNDVKLTITSPDTKFANGGGILLYTNSELTFTGNVSVNGAAAIVEGINAGDGKLKLERTDGTKQDFALGVNNIASVEFAGGDVTMSGEVGTGGNAVAFEFTGDLDKVIDFTNEDTNLNTSTFNRTGDGNVTVKVASATNFSQLNLNDKSKEITYQGDTLEVSGGNVEYGNFIPETNAGTFTTDRSVKSFGSALKAFDTADIKGGTVSGGAYAKTINAIESVKFGGVVKGETFRVSDGKTVTFLEGAVVDSVVSAVNPGNKATTVFEGAATIKKSISSDAVTFQGGAGKQITLEENVTATNGDLTIGVGGVKLSGNRTLTASGNIRANGSTVDLGTDTLTVSGKTVVTNTLSINSTIQSNNDVVSVGKVLFATPAADEVNFATADAKIQFNLTEVGVSAPGTYEVFGKSNSPVSLDKFDFNVTSDPSSLLSWDLVANAGVVSGESSYNGAGDKLKESLSSAGLSDFGDVADSFAAALIRDSKSAAGQTAINIGQLRAVSKTEAANAMQQLATTSDGVNQVVADVVSGANSQSMKRLASVTGADANFAAGNSRVVGVSAGGCDHTNHGVWTSGFYGKTSQKARKFTAGYTDESYGVTVGADTRVNDSMILGAALTSARSDVKYKDFRANDKTKVDSVLFSIYGQHQINHNWFADAVFTVGSNKVKNNAKRNVFSGGALGYENVSSKYDVMSFGADLTFGYNMHMDQMTMTPTFGVAYGRTNQTGYDETGATSANRTVTTKAYNRIDLTAGMKVAAMPMDMKGMMLTPEVHASISHDVIGKNPKSSIKIGEDFIASKTSKPSRTNYNVGFSLESSYANVDYSAGYDLDLADKRTGHRGTLKVRVNF